MPGAEKGIRNPGWPWWSGPLALVVGLVAALVGSLIVDIPAALAGVNLSRTPPGLELADTVVQDIAFVGAALWCAVRFGAGAGPERFGLRTPRVRQAAGLVVGLLVAFLLFNAGWGSLLHLGDDRQLLDQLGVQHSRALAGLSVVLVCLIAPVCEEFLFRGYMFTALRNWRGPWPAALITGVIFGLVHVASAPIGFLLPLALFGVGLCLLFWRTGSLYPGIAAHAINNSIAFGATERWPAASVAALVLGALAVLTLTAVALRSAGLTAPGRAVA